MSARKPSLDDLVREARRERTPEVDWTKVEGPLMARVEREARERAAIEAYEGRSRGWTAAAFGLAAAAAAALFLTVTHGDSDRAASLDDMGRVARDPVASVLSWKDGLATLQVTRDGIAHDAVVGEPTSRGDVLEAHRGRVVLARTDPSGVTWSLEDNSRTSVRGARGTLILALERGAIEAQVAPVPSGEAFAIDVEGTRVAVHGTHLRVARDGARAIVDLREGVVSIGAPPAHGSTYGDLITAPAHVEFDPADPHGTLKVSHEPSRVRAASPLEQRPEGNHPSAPPAPPPPPARPAAATPPVPARLPLSTAPGATAPIAPPAALSPPVPPPPTPAHADADPEKTISDAVRACLQSHVAQANGVVVTVSSHIELQVGDTGMVSTARFDPPLAPDVQQCAAKTIYQTRFAAPGAVSIPVDVTP